MKILVTGMAGFIGFHLSRRLANEGHELLGLDNINDYYSPGLKFDRLSQLGIEKDEVATDHIVQSSLFPQLRFINMNLEDSYGMQSLFRDEHFDMVIHLGAQAGVRYSLLKPQAYLVSNIEGFLNILEGCRVFPVRHLLFASSSSVYGLNRKVPFSVHDPANHPVSLYAATKKSNEMMAHTYSHLFRIPITGLRFFTVYGPWGRPDMAYFSFTKSIFSGKEIQLFNEGNMMRDFTYIDDVINGMVKAINHIPEPMPDWNPMHPDPSGSSAPFRIYNLGNHQPVSLSHFIETLEKLLGKKAVTRLVEMQPGDVEATYADIEDATLDFDFRPVTSIEQGLEQFVNWYLEYYKLK